ncbi:MULTISPECIES: hypothetical protein [unclassified Granulicatella]|uniref:hypothetical protein n=1 Tax=unclassified Granulicatella TaxID=2630493 RepID=UPI0010749302|nr:MULTISPECIES: hypothetical protein [unclassified Granulicatella]MBF0779837.1 hypothetical protein [Granulicatella sp. 19428wC4_WM01]TFU96137.1 hypothetical protein E4T68_01895 [Granulicatella sp. WM01]
MILPKYTILTKLFKRIRPSRQSITTHRATTYGEERLLVFVQNLLQGEYAHIDYTQADYISNANIRYRMQWIILEAMIYRGDLDLARHIFKDLEHVKMSGEYSVIGALYYMYSALDFDKARQMLYIAEKTLSNDTLYQEEYAYRVQQIEMMKEIITLGE